MDIYGRSEYCTDAFRAIPKLLGDLKMSFKECLDVVRCPPVRQNVERPDGHPSPGRPICIYHKELKEVLFQLPPAPKAGVGLWEKVGILWAL